MQPNNLCRQEVNHSIKLNEPPVQWCIGNSKHLQSKQL